MLIIPDCNIMRNRIIFWIVMFQRIGHNHHVGRSIFADNIVKNMNISVRHYHDADTRGHAGNDIAFGGKIGRHIVHHNILKYPHIAAAQLRQVRQIKHQNASCIACRNIVINISIKAVFNFDTRDIFICNRSAHDDVSRLTDIYASI